MMFLGAQSQSQIGSINSFWFSKFSPRLRPSFSRILAVFRIRIRMDPINFGRQDPDPEGKMTHKSMKMSINFMFLRAGCSLLRTEGFCSLAPYEGLE